MPTDKYLLNAAENEYVNAASDIWNLTPDRPTGDGSGLVAIEDIGVCDANSGNLTLAGAFTSVGLNMLNWPSGRELDLSTYDMTINGDIEDLGGSGGVDGTGTIIISGTGTHSIHDDATIASTVTLKFTAGSGTPTFGPGDSALPIIGGLTIDNGPTSFIVGASTTGLRIAGPLTYTAGKFDTITNQVKTLLSGTSNWKWDVEASRLYHVELVDGAAITMTTNCRIEEFTWGTGTLGGAKVLRMVLGRNNTWHQGDGDIIVSHVRFEDIAGGSPVREVGTLSLPLTEVRVGQTRGVRLRQMGDWAVGAVSGDFLRIQDGRDDRHSEHDCNGYALTLGGNLEIGQEGIGAGGGFIFFGEGVITVAGDIKVSLNNDAGADNQNKIAAESCNMILGGTWTGTGMDVTSAGANVVGGSFIGVDCAGVLHTWGSDDDGTSSVDVTRESSLGGATANLGTGMMMAA